MNNNYICYSVEMEVEHKFIDPQKALYQIIKVVE